MVLPEGFQAFFLLKAANLSPDHQKLARATCSKLTYKDMKSNILKVFGDFSHRGDITSSSSGIAIKTEPVYYADNESDALYARHGGRGRVQGGQDKRKFFNRRKFGHRGGGKNPEGWTCFRCGSPDHLIKDCPRPGNHEEKAKSNEVHITLIVFFSETDSHLLELVQESIGKALLDCGCTKTVTGKLWLDGYLSMLCDNELSQVKYESANNTFRFGDGVEVKSQQVVNLPVSFGDTGK